MVVPFKRDINNMKSKDMAGGIKCNYESCDFVVEDENVNNIDIH